MSWQDLFLSFHVWPVHLHVNVLSRNKTYPGFWDVYVAAKENENADILFHLSHGILNGSRVGC